MRKRGAVGTFLADRVGDGILFLLNAFLTHFYEFDAFAQKRDALMKNSNIKRRARSVFASLVRAGRLLSGVALLALFLPAVSHLNENEPVSELA